MWETPLLDTDDYGELIADLKFPPPMIKVSESPMTQLWDIAFLRD